MGVPSVEAMSTVHLIHPLSRPGRRAPATVPPSRASHRGLLSRVPGALALMLLAAVDADAATARIGGHPTRRR